MNFILLLILIVLIYIGEKYKLSGSYSQRLDEAVEWFKSQITEVSDGARNEKKIIHTIL